MTSCQSTCQALGAGRRRGGGLGGVGGGRRRVTQRGVKHCTKITALDP